MEKRINIFSEKILLIHPNNSINSKNSYFGLSAAKTVSCKIPIGIAGKKKQDA